MTKWYGNVPAPTDKDGSVVPLDTKELAYRGDVRETCAFSYSTRHGCWGVVFENGDSISLNACTMPDSWEKLEEDALKTPREYVEVRGITAVIDGRVAAMVGDIVRRAKALAGVSELPRSSTTSATRRGNHERV